MLGSGAEAEDAVQEACLWLSRAEPDGVAHLRGWLTTVVGRLCLDVLRSRRSRPEAPMGEHVLEPVEPPGRGTDPEHEALLADSVGSALLVVLETLTPAERIAFVLHDRSPSVRRDRPGAGADAGRGQAARQPGAPPGARVHGGRRERPGPSAGGRAGLPRRLAASRDGGLR